MKAYYITPSDIGMGEWSNDWLKFLKTLGIKEHVNYICISVIELPN